MFIINPDPYSLPAYRIGPFKTKDISKNNKLPKSCYIDQYFHNRFEGKEFVYTSNGREAINKALSHYKLLNDDVVTIFTSTGNFYISSCVTKEIEKFCKWSRDIEVATKVILVNHEFGYPYKNMIKLKETGIPIIEDCAQSFFSQNENKTIGTFGDFVIYSFPKMFPIQIGGLLIKNINFNSPDSGVLENNKLGYIKNVLSYYIKNKDEILRKRIYNYLYLAKKFELLGLKERFPLIDGAIPGVFMFRKGNYQFALADLKKYFQIHGVQCSVFYGEESFFLPIHQALNEGDLDYFSEVMKSFINQTER